MMTVSAFRTLGRRSAAWRELRRTADNTGREWQDKRPRGAAMGGCGFSGGFGKHSHLAQKERSLRVHFFSSTLNTLMRCAESAR
jgi:hypothetical protein